jgi:hypothetical protein
MNKGQHYSYGVGDKIYKLQVVVVQQASEEIPHGEVESALEEGRKYDLLLNIFARELLPSRGPPLHPPFGRSSPWSTKAWIFASFIVDRTHAVCGSGMEAVSDAIPPLGFTLDLLLQRVLTCMR